MHFANEKDKRIKELENENKSLKDMITRLELNVEALTQAVCMQRRNVLEHQVKKRKC